VLKTREDSDPHPSLLPAGAYRFAPDPVQKSESEKQKGRKVGGLMLSFARDELGTFTNCKFCMILLALIPVMNYNA
jgi:hypothetical protein